MKKKNPDFGKKRLKPKKKQVKYRTKDGKIVDHWVEGCEELEALGDGEFYDENNNVCKKDKDGKVIIVKKADKIMTQS